MLNASGNSYRLKKRVSWKYFLQRIKLIWLRVSSNPMLFKSQIKQFLLFNQFFQLRAVCLHVVHSLQPKAKPLLKKEAVDVFDEKYTYLEVLVLLQKIIRYRNICLPFCEVSGGKCAAILSSQPIRSQGTDDSSKDVIKPERQRMATGGLFYHAFRYMLNDLVLVSVNCQNPSQQDPFFLRNQR